MCWWQQKEWYEWYTCAENPFQCTTNAINVYVHVTLGILGSKTAKLEFFKIIASYNVLNFLTMCMKNKQRLES